VEAVVGKPRAGRPGFVLRLPRPWSAGGAARGAAGARAASAVVGGSAAFVALGGACLGAGPRDRGVLLYTGVRLAELVALDVGEVRTSARKGLVIVRSRKGDECREVPLNALARQVLDEWLADRKKLAAPTEPAA